MKPGSRPIAVQWASGGRHSVHWGSMFGLAAYGWCYKFTPVTSTSPQVAIPSPQTHTIEILSVYTTPATPAMPKSGTQRLNEYQNRGHTIQYEEYTCTTHSESNPQYGCKVWVDGGVKGVANNEPSKKRAKEAAALEAVTSLLLDE